MTLNTENIANPQMEPKSSSRKCNQVFGITDSESFTPLLKTLCPHFWNLIKASQSDWRILAFLLIQRWSCESVLDHCPALELQGMNRWPDNRLPDCLVETTRSWSKSAPDHDHHHACLLAWCSWCYARCNGTQTFQKVKLSSHYSAFSKSLEDHQYVFLANVSWAFCSVVFSLELSDILNELSFCF